jgi:Skp family chaperone for outer membrane proteins
MSKKAIREKARSLVGKLEADTPSLQVLPLARSLVADIEAEFKDVVDEVEKVVDEVKEVAEELSKRKSKVTEPETVTESETEVDETPVEEKNEKTPEPTTE